MKRARGNARMRAILGLVRRAARIAVMAAGCPFGGALGAAESGSVDAQDVHVNIALTEMQTLAQAEEWVAIDTQFYVSLENLNDIGVDGYNPDYDFIGDGGGTFVIRPSRAVFETGRRNLTAGFLVWDGPYVNYQIDRTDRYDTYNFDIGTPLDPWGGLYYFFTPAGLVKPPNNISLDYYGDSFDRYAIVTLGPNMQYGGGDDLIYYFGSAPTALTLTSARPFTLRTGDTLRLKGYNFGPPGAGLHVLLNGANADAGITSWTSTLILKTILPADPTGAVTVALGRDGDTPTTPPLTVTIQPPVDAADPGYYLGVW